LRGFGTLVNRSGIVVARNSRAQTAEAFEILVVDTLRQVESSYWNLVAARRAVQVAEQSLALAERLLGETQERVCRDWRRSTSCSPRPGWRPDARR
jgi:outer membrane protein TolC